MFYVPDLNFETALTFCAELDSYEPNTSWETFDFDFSNVKNCDPFPMLMVSNGIRQLREKFSEHQFSACNCDNDYCAVILIFKQIILVIAPYLWYYKRNGGDYYGKTQKTQY